MKSFEPQSQNRELPNHLEKSKDFSKEQEVFLNKELKEMNDGALSEEDFRGKIPDEVIDRCLSEVQEYEDFFLQKNKIEQIKNKIEDKDDTSPEYIKVSEYLEALFYNKLGGEKGWIPGSIIWKTSRYDDIKGIDFIIENNKREFSLETDITFSSGKGLIHKLDGIKRQIDAGGFSQPIFYESENGSVGNMPKVIVAVDREKAVKALGLWADGQGDLLNEHPIMVKTLLEIEAQLEASSLYSKAVGKRNIASSCNDTLAQIQKLIISREDLIKRYQNIIEEDKAYKVIISFCDKLKEEANRLIKQG